MARELTNLVRRQGHAGVSNGLVDTALMLSKLILKAEDHTGARADTIPTADELRMRLGESEEICCVQLSVDGEPPYELDRHDVDR